MRGLSHKSCIFKAFIVSILDVDTGFFLFNPVRYSNSMNEFAIVKLQFINLFQY